MLYFFRRIFRYKLVSIYFIVSQLIILTAMFGALQIINKAYAKENDRLNSIAKNRIELDVVSMSEGNILKNAGNGIIDGNIIAEGLSTEFSEAGSKNKCEMLIAINEELPYPLIQGHIPGTADSDIGTKVVALGRDKYKYAYDRNGEKYVTLNQDEYKVVGVIGSENSDFWDYRIVFNIECLGSGMERNIKACQEFKIMLYSNSKTLVDSYNEMYSNILKTDEMCNIVAYNRKSQGESVVNYTLNRENFKINIIVYIFCLLNCIIISIFWIIQHKKEYAIKRTFGYGSVRLLIQIAAEIITLMIISFIIFQLFNWVLQLCKVTDGYSLSGIRYIISVLVLHIITLVITMCYPVVAVYRDCKAK